MASLEEIRETFAFIDDWETRYRFILELGKAVPELETSSKLEEHLVRGCQSQVWLLPRHDRVADQLHFKIDSDAHIVRGLIAIVLAVYDQKSPAEVASFPIEELFAELDLLQHLSPTRGNGLRSMVGRIQQIASECLN